MAKTALTEGRGVFSVATLEEISANIRCIPFNKMMQATSYMQSESTTIRSLSQHPNQNMVSKKKLDEFIKTFKKIFCFRYACGMEVGWPLHQTTIGER